MPQPRVGKMKLSKITLTRTACVVSVYEVRKRVQVASTFSNFEWSNVPGLPTVLLHVYTHNKYLVVNTSTLLVR